MPNYNSKSKSRLSSDDNSKLNFIYDFDQSALPSFKFNMSQIANNDNDLSCQIATKEDINIISFNNFSINACGIKAGNIFAYSSKNLYLLGGYKMDDMFFIYTHGSISFIANNGASLSPLGINKPTEPSVEVRTFHSLQDSDKLVIMHTKELYVYTSNPVDFLHNIKINKEETVYIYHPNQCDECELASQTEQLHDEL